MAGNLTAMIAAAFSGGAAPPVTSDPYFDYTTLLLPGNGTNGAQNNTFLDGSTNNFTITRNGNTTQGTFSPFSQTGWGNYFSGSSQYLTVPNGTFVLGSNNFVIESFIYTTDITSAARSIVVGQTDAATAGGSSWDFTINQTTGTLKGVLWIGGSATVITSTNAVPLNQWVHVAFVRTGGTGSLFINGTKDGTNTGLGTSSVQTGSTTYAPSIGRNGTGSFFSGYICNFGVVIGAGASSVYNATSSSITVPTSPLTAVTNTVVLTCQSNRFVDNSSSPVTVTPSGSPTVVAFSPFNPSASWSAATYGGSGYFDVADDFLTWGPGSSVQFGTGNFTIEVWIYPTVTLAGQYIIDARNSGQTTTFALLFGATAPGRLAFFDGSIIAVEEAASSIKANEWAHCCVVRSGSTISLFINGVRAGVNSSYSGNMSTAPTLSYIGKRYAAVGGDDFEFPGYMSSLRIVKGTAVYDPTQTNITIPTAPLTAITNTSLLLNFTNAGIYDATSKNDLETVGNAQISTTQSKFGGSSIVFDGTSDYLVFPSSNLFTLGDSSANFTIETWVYSTGTPGTDAVIAGTWQNGTSAYANRWLLSLRTSGTAIYWWDSTGSPGITYTGISTGQWVYIAVVRSGGTITLYVNGVSRGTQTTNQAYTTQDVLRVGGGISGTSDFPGYIQDLRITKGYARTITASPTAAFPTL